MLVQLALLLGVPPGEGQLPYVTGEEPLLSGFVQVGFDREEVSDQCSKITWTRPPRASSWWLMLCTPDPRLRQSHADGEVGLEGGDESLGPRLLPHIVHG